MLGDVADTDEAGVTCRDFVTGACLLVDVSGAVANDDGASAGAVAANEESCGGYCERDPVLTG